LGAPARLEERIMLLAVPTQDDAEARLVALGEAPGAHRMRHGAILHAVEVHIPAGLRTIGRIEEDSRHAVFPGDTRAEHATPVATTDADPAQAGLQGIKPVAQAAMVLMDALTAMVEVEPLAVDALPSGTQLHTAAQNAPAGSQVRKLPLHARLSARLGHELAAFTVPRATPATPAAANPRTDPIDPVPRELRIVVVGVAHEAARHGLALPHQPDVHGVQVRLDDRPITPPGHRRRCGPQGPEHVTHKAIPVVDRFQAGGMGAAQQGGERARKGFHIVAHRAERLPDERRGAALPAKPGEGGFERCPRRDLIQVCKTLTDTVRVLTLGIRGIETKTTHLQSP
jgi:hypothetical protein